MDVPPATEVNHCQVVLCQYMTSFGCHAEEGLCLLQGHRNSPAIEVDRSQVEPCLGMPLQPPCTMNLIGHGTRI